MNKSIATFSMSAVIAAALVWSGCEKAAESPKEQPVAEHVVVLRPNASQACIDEPTDAVCAAWARALEAPVKSSEDCLGVSSE